MTAARVTADATAPAGNATNVAPSNSNDIPTTRALYVGVSGDVCVTMALMNAGDSITFKNVPIGILPVQVSRIWVSNTTAQQMIALY